MLRKFVGGNWKCNNTLAESKKLLEGLAESTKALSLGKVDVVVAPVFLHIAALIPSLPKGFQVAAQNCSDQGFGAFTGQISAKHLKDLNVPYVIIGHSERRTLYKECNNTVQRKLASCLTTGLKAIACFGETLEERKGGRIQKVLEEQLQAITKGVAGNWDNVVLAYEPVWAIGTGVSATTAEVKDTHALIRQLLKKHSPGAQKSSLIYGGSVSEKNCGQLAKIAHVDGFLVGGAALKKDSFTEIIKSVATL